MPTISYERVPAAEIRLGDRVARARTHPFHEVTEVRHAGSSAMLVLDRAGRVKPRLTAMWWREVTA